MAQDVTIAGASYTDVPAVTLPKTGGGEATFYDMTDINYAASNEPGGNALKTNAIHYGQVDSTSTATVFTAQIPGITSYYDGLTVMLKNGVVTSAADFTININGLGAKKAYSNMAAATAETTLFNVNYTMLFVYDSTRVEGGGWILYRGYNSNDNTIGYQLRTNSSTRPASDKFYRYRILFSSADDKKWVPANTSTSTNATASRAVNQRPINPFGEIAYYGTTTAIDADANVTAAQLWRQYTITFGYSFNRTGAALVLTYPAPVYIKCAPQADGSAIIDADTPYVHDLPSTADGKIYIYLGRAYSATAIEMVYYHPVYYYKDGAIRLWTNAAASGSADEAMTDAEIEDAVDEAFAVSGYTVTVSFTNPRHSGEFGATDVMELVSGSSFNPSDIRLGTISSPTGSETYLINTTSYGLGLLVGGVSPDGGTAMVTGNVSLISGGGDTWIFAVTGNGTITIDGIDYDG